MGLKDNILKGDRIFDPREGRQVRKDELLPPIGNKLRRSENEAFIAGVMWFLSHCSSYRFDPEHATHVELGDGLVLPAARAEADRLFPNFDPPPPPTTKRQRTGL